MKKKVIGVVSIALICVIGLFAVLFLYRDGNQYISVRKAHGDGLPHDVSALLYYSQGAVIIPPGETYFFSDHIIKEESEYYIAYSHVFSDARITSNFAIPLGYENGEDIPVKLGQIMDHKNFRDVEVLTVLNWKSEKKQFTILYNIDSKMNRVDFPATGGAYLGTYKDENHIYIVSNLENYLQICDIDILSHSHEIKQVSYKNLVRFGPDLAEAMTVIKDGVLYLGEGTHNLEEGTIYSTISSYDLVNERKLNELHFENELIYNLSFYEDTLVALMSTGKDEKGYYQELTYHEIDAEDLAVKTSQTIEGLPDNIDTINLRDKSKIHQGLLYTVIEGIIRKRDYIMVYNLKTQEIEFLAELQLKNSNKSLSDWNFLIRENDEMYEIE